MRFPTMPDEMTGEWLTQILRDADVIKDGRVDSFEAKPIGGVKGALGQLFRVNLTVEPVDTLAPQTLIAKFAPADAEWRMNFHHAGFFEREVRFYRELAEEVTLSVPDCYYSALNEETGEFVLLLEDLAPARNGDRLAGCSLAEAALAIGEAARFHAAWWDNPQRIQRHWTQSPDVGNTFQVVQYLYQQSWPPFASRLASSLPNTIVAIGQRLEDQAIAVYEHLHRPPQTLVHSDFMLDNFFFADVDGELSLTVIDWQLLSVGRGAVDVASLLGGNLSIDDRRTHEMNLLRTYHAVLLEHGVRDYSFAQCLDDYRLAMLDGFVRMVISIGGDGLTDEQARAHREIIWPRFCAAVLDLNVDELLSSILEEV